jgi:CheY-like chemotaxis protein
MKDTARVLVVDDDRVIGQSFDRVLTQKGYEVSTALSGQEALDKLGSNGYDMVFTDIKMPGMDGIEVARRVKEMNPWLPVVVVTGYGSAENEARAEEVGVEGFLHKPLSPEVIEWITKKTLSEKEEAVAEPQARSSVEVRPVAEVQEKENVAKNIALFFAAPFIGLAYIVAFPFIGFAMLAKWGFRTLTAKGAK